MTKRVLAFMVAFAACGNVVAKDSAVAAESAKVEAKEVAGWGETIASYTTKPVEGFMQNHPWYGIVTVAVATVAAERAAMYAYDNFVAEQSDDLEVE